MAGTDPALIFGEPHRRRDPLRDEWVLVSPGRDARPWQGGLEAAPAQTRPPYDPQCYLCPGNGRANGERNPAYSETHVFTNDFAALRPSTPEVTWDGGLLRAVGEPGTCRVVCYSPRHDLSLGGMDIGAVRRVIDVWAEQTAELGRRWRWVQVFENRGEAMGASNPHPHGQIWAGSALPGEAAKEDATQREHRGRTGRQLLQDIADIEAGGPRVVSESPSWLVVVPFWAVWPFETLIVAREVAPRLTDLSDVARDELASVLRALVRRYDALFGVPFPYSMGWHGAPFAAVGTDGADATAEGAASAAEAWRLHAHVYPPLLRSAAIRKFMVGYELLAEPQRDLLPEHAAERLRTIQP